MEMLRGDYTQRIHIQAIAQFIMTGEAGRDVDKGTPLERYKRYDKKIDKELRRFVARGCKDWDRMSDDEKTNHFERESGDIWLLIDKVTRLYMEIGAMVGIRLLSQYQEVSASFPERPPSPPLDMSTWRPNEIDPEDLDDDE